MQMTRQEANLSPQEFKTLIYVFATPQGRAALKSATEGLDSEQLRNFKKAIGSHVWGMTRPATAEWDETKKKTYLEKMHADPSSMVRKCLGKVVGVTATTSKPAPATVKPTPTVVTLPPQQVVIPLTDSQPSWPAPFKIEELLDF